MIKSKKALTVQWADIVIAIIFAGLAVFFIFSITSMTEAGINKQQNEINQDIQDHSALFNFLRMPLRQELMNQEEKIFVTKFNLQNNADLIDFMLDPPWTLEEVRILNLARDILKRDVSYLGEIYETDYFSLLVKQEKDWEIYAEIENPVTGTEKVGILKSCEINEDEECEVLPKNKITEIYIPLQNRPGKVAKIILSTPKKEE